MNSFKTFTDLAFYIHITAKKKCIRTCLISMCYYMRVNVKYVFQLDVLTHEKEQR